MPVRPKFNVVGDTPWVRPKFNVVDPPTPPTNAPETPAAPTVLGLSPAAAVGVVVAAMGLGWLASRRR